MVKLRKKIKVLLSALLAFGLLFSVSACSSNETVLQNETVSQTEEVTAETTNTEYKQSPDFVFEVDKDHIEVNKFGKITLNCSLKNVSDKDYYIEHGVETITYSYNGESEEMDLIAIMDTFKSKSEINRTLNLRAKKSGKIIVYATFYVKPEKFSDQREIYQYTKEVDVVVK